jgi:hypothetical protein
MTWDSGGAIILSTLIGVMLVWMGNLVSKHFGNNEQTADHAHERIAALAEKISEVAMDLLKHQRYVAENYVPKQAFDRIEAKLDRLIERQWSIHD